MSCNWVWPWGAARVSRGRLKHSAECRQPRCLAWPAAARKSAQRAPHREGVALPAGAFAQNPGAAKCLAQRWGLLQQEGRFQQLRWEVGLLLQREPGFALAAAVQGTIPRQLPQPRARVVVASLFAGKEFAQTMLPARRNHERWCALHGYTYACLEEDIAGRADPTWSKLPHVLSLLKQGAEFVFWMDADSLFISDGADLQWACDLGKDFVFAGDLNLGLVGVASSSARALSLSLSLFLFFTATQNLTNPQCHAAKAFREF